MIISKSDPPVFRNRRIAGFFDGRTVDTVVVWYVSYGSNMASARLRCYLEGGRPPGGSLAHPGARDGTLPRASVPILLPGAVFFAGESRVWTGGRAFYDAGADGEVAARAYLVTEDQFADIHAQEPACYDRILDVGVREGVPMRTFTTRARADAIRRSAPAPAYLAVMAQGLRESHGWDEARIARYLGGWRPDAADLSRATHVT